jgi:hypothetical protein
MLTDLARFGYEPVLFEESARGGCRLVYFIARFRNFSDFFLNLAGCTLRNDGDHEKLIKRESCRPPSANFTISDLF